MIFMGAIGNKLSLGKIWGKYLEKQKKIIQRLSQSTIDIVLYIYIIRLHIETFIPHIHASSYTYIYISYPHFLASSKYMYIHVYYPLCDF